MEIVRLLEKNCCDFIYYVLISLFWIFCFLDNKIDYVVLLVGYGIENSIFYWLIKNFWLYNWGDNGFIKIRYGLCGVEKRLFVVFNKEWKFLLW